jgi:shikimate kinase
MTLPPNVILLGFMGAGKSSTGKELSQLLKFKYWDMDQWIEEINKMPVSEIFETMGESYFRLEELKAAAWIKNQIHVVQSLGGGAWLTQRLRDEFLKSGWCVWLKVSPGQCFSRVEKNISKRPLLAKQEQPKEFLTQLLKQREPVYSLAHHSIDTDRKTPKEVALEIHEFILKVKPFDLPQMPP